MEAASSSFFSAAICAAIESRVQSPRPVRMKLAPPSFSSCSGSLPLGAFTPSGGGFEKPIGKTSFPSIRSAPVGPMVTAVTAPRSYACATDARAPAARTAALSAAMSYAP